MPNKLTYAFNKDKFVVKKESKGVVIEGLANALVVDRGDDIIDKEAWDLSNFEKNPVILFNHGYDLLGELPIGQAIGIAKTDEGLKIRVKISSSKSELITAVRDSILEGNLRTFSVGFRPMESENDDESGVRRITKAELLEVSVVSIPMNQDSIFQVTQKNLLKESSKMFKKRLLDKKAKFALKMLDGIENLEEKGISCKEILSSIGEKTGLDSEIIEGILMGKSIPTDKKFLESISESLEIDLDELKGLIDDDNTENDSQLIDQFKQLVLSKVSDKISNGQIKDDPTEFISEVIKEIISTDEKFNEIDLNNEIADFLTNEVKKLIESNQSVIDGEQKQTSEISTEPTEFDDKGPGLELQKAQLAMLGKIATTLDMINGKLDGLTQGPIKPYDETVEDEMESDDNDEMKPIQNPNEMDDEKLINEIQTKMNAIADRIKKLE